MKIVSGHQIYPYDSLENDEFARALPSGDSDFNIRYFLSLLKAEASDRLHQVHAHTISPETFLSDTVLTFYQEQKRLSETQFPFAADIFIPGYSYVATSLEDNILFSDHKAISFKSSLPGARLLPVKDRYHGGRHMQFWLNYYCQPATPESYSFPLMPPPWSAGIKGSGLINPPDRITGNVGEGKVTLFENLQLPIHRLERLEGSRETSSHYEYHKLWGGLSLNHASGEFSNLIGLSFFLSQVCASTSSLIPFPFQIGIYEELPVIHGEKTVIYYSVQAYKEQFLGDMDEDLSFLVTLSLGDLRINTAEALLRSAGLYKFDGSIYIIAPDRVQKEVNRILALIYGLNGETFIEPTHDYFKKTDRNDNDAYAPQILRYLMVCYELNKASADKILASFKQNTLRILGAIHGGAGHAGGMYQKGYIFTNFSSSFAPRNCSVNASPRDWDEDVLIPDLTEKTIVQPYHDGRQLADLDNWQVSAVKMELLLRGLLINDNDPWPDFSMGHIGGEPVFNSTSTLKFFNLGRERRLVNTADIFRGGNKIIDLRFSHEPDQDSYWTSFNTAKRLIRS